MEIKPTKSTCVVAGAPTLNSPLVAYSCLFLFFFSSQD